MTTEELIRAVLDKICQDNFRTGYLQLLRQMGESNDDFDNGLRFFVAKLISKYRFRLGQASVILSLIHNFYAYGHRLDSEKLQSYLEGD
jgi:hypothetical protein